MSTVRLPLIVLASAVFTVALTGPAFIKDFKGTYGVKAGSMIAKASCGLCHVGKTVKLNPYGQDLKTVLVQEKAKVLTGSALKKVEGIDSDRDGVKNIDEIKHDSLPGDPRSK